MAALCVLATISAVPSKAAVVFESASFTGIDTGEYIVQDGRFIGAAFTVTQTTAITGIGAQFGGFPDGTIFGAIVLSSPTAFPFFAKPACWRALLVLCPAVRPMARPRPI